MGRTARIRQRRRSINKFKVEHEETDEVANLLIWLRRQGWNIVGSSGLKPAWFQSGSAALPVRGLKSCCRVGCGDVLISLPCAALITSRTALESADVGHLLRRLTPLSGQLCLTLFLVHELSLGHTSRYYPYLCTLPSSYSTPLQLHREEVSEHFLPRIVLGDVQQLRLSVRREFSRVCAELARASCAWRSRLREDLFVYAWSTIDTRSVYYNHGGELDPGTVLVADTCALAPFVDLLNHSSVVSTHLQIADGNYCLLSGSAIESGTEALINYGAMDCRQLLLRYGFIPGNDSSEGSSVCVRLDDLPISQRVRDLAVQLGLCNSGDLLPAASLISDRFQCRCDSISWSLAACCWLEADTKLGAAPWALSTIQLLEPPASGRLYAELLAVLWWDISWCLYHGELRRQSGLASDCLLQFLRLYRRWLRVLQQYVVSPRPHPSAMSAVLQSDWSQYRPANSDYLQSDSVSTVTISVLITDDWPVFEIRLKADRPHCKGSFSES